MVGSCSLAELDLLDEHHENEYGGKKHNKVLDASRRRAVPVVAEVRVAALDSLAGLELHLPGLLTVLVDVAEPETEKNKK